MRLLGFDHGTMFTIAVVRATSTAVTRYNRNDDGEEDNWTGNGACISSVAPTSIAI